MPNTLDPTTQIGQVRYLVGDTNIVAPSFSDAEITGFINMAPDQSTYLACALILDSMASTVAASLNELQMGYLRIQETAKFTALKTQADRFRDLEYNTPAFAVAEENLSGFNELNIIRNFILRTES